MTTDHARDEERDDENTILEVTRQQLDVLRRGGMLARGTGEWDWEVHEPESVMRRRVENEVLGEPGHSVMEADPELEALLDEEERIANEHLREKRVVSSRWLRGPNKPPKENRKLMSIKLTQHFTHNGREADLEIERVGMEVKVRIKTIEEQPVTEMRPFWEGDEIRKRQTEVEVVTQRTMMGKMVELEFTVDEWARFIDAAEVFGNLR